MREREREGSGERVSEKGREREVGREELHVGVLCCFALFVCLILLASFFLPSHLSFKNMYIYTYLFLSGLSLYLHP